MLRRKFLVHGIAAGAITSLATSARAATQRAGTAEPVNIVTTAGTTQLVLEALLEQQGYLREFGIAPNFINVADGNKVVAALISGAMDICPTSGFTQVLAAIGKGAPLKIVAGGAIKNFYAVVSGKADVRTLKDLERHSVGIGALGSQLHQTMIALFRKYGVDSSKVTYANVGASVDVFRAVKAGVVDAGAVEMWLQPGSGLHVLQNGLTFESLPEFVNQAAFVTERTIAQKRDQVVRTLAAYAKLYRFIMAGDSEAAFVAASARALGNSDPAAARSQWKFYREIQPFAAGLYLDESRIRYMQELNIATGSQKVVMPFDKVADMSLARDALKLLG